MLKQAKRQCLISSAELTKEEIKKSQKKSSVRPRVILGRDTGLILLQVLKGLKTKQDQMQPNCPARIQHNFLFEQGLKDLASQSSSAIICKYTTPFNFNQNCSKPEMDCKYLEFGLAGEKRSQCILFFGSRQQSWKQSHKM